jgi:catechol 2,3-dioxygenase-like lactoylglutathione lyase family enzyme
MVSKVVNMAAFVPAKDYELSRRFYADLGFTEKWGDGNACELVRDGFSFILQNFYVKEQADNFMMSLLVEDADSWWELVQRAGLKQKYGLHLANAPTLQPWGLRVLYLTDPTGVLWHIADRPA